MKICANNTNAVTVNIVNSFDMKFIFENLNQEWICKNIKGKKFGDSDFGDTFMLVTL